MLLPKVYQLNIISSVDGSSQGTTIIAYITSGKLFVHCVRQSSQGQWQIKYLTRCPNFILILHSANKRATNTMADSLAEAEISELQETFSFFDKNQDGKVTMEELQTALESLGQTVTRTELQGIINGLDMAQNDTVDFSEFVQIMSQSDLKNLSDIIKRKEVNDAFHLFDKDGDGFITSEEIKKVMGILGKKMRDDEINEMIKEADTNADGMIDYEEYVKMMKAKD